LGKYVKSAHYGWGDNRGRVDTFINDQGQEVSHYLDYDGTTRYQRIKSRMEERLPFLKLVESTGGKKNEGGKNEHINTYLLNEIIVREVCTFMNPV